MRLGRTRRADATFELNLAPLLDVIVVIIPMLLLSVAFIQIKMVETNVPQVVAQKIADDKKKKDVPVTVEMRASKKSGFQITVVERGVRRNIAVAPKNNQMDYDQLQQSMANIKRQYADVFRMDFAPSADIAYEDIIKTMDTVRNMPKGQKVAFTDTTSGKKVETDLMFPDVTFSNVLGD